MTYFESEIDFLQKYLDDDSCEGDCDIAPPYEKCLYHIAVESINMAGDILREGIDDIKKRTVIPE